MSRIAQKVHELALPLAEQLGLELWDVEYVKEAGQWYLRVYIDRIEGGVSLDDCEAFSKAFDPVLDAEDPIEDSYVFEVSSAGAERVLKRPRDFDRFLGSFVEVKLYKAVDGAKFYTGILAAYADGDVTVRIGDTQAEKTFPAAAVAQVRLRIQ